MILKVIGTIAFLFIIFLKKMYISMGWWDIISFLIVFGGSLLVWFIYFLRKREWDFFAKNVSIFLGLIYGVVWGIELAMSGNSSLIFPLVTIPIGYGFVVSLIAEGIYARKG